MKVKAVQIAKTLGISKAAVSLSLNGRPGVNEQTRKKILACKEKIAVPDKVSLIGVNVIPAYMTGDCKLTAVRIPHTERARLAMMMLAREIEKQSTTKSRIMTDCRLVEGESVREGNKLS